MESPLGIAVTFFHTMLIWFSSIGALKGDMACVCGMPVTSLM